MSFGQTPLSTTPLGTNQFPVSGVAEPGLSGGNLTALEGGPGSVDSNSNRTAPASVYVKDGGNVTFGTQADSAATSDGGTFTFMALVKRLLAKFPAIGQQVKSSSMSVTIASDQGNIPVSGTITSNAGTNLNTSLLALEAGGNLATLVTNTADLLADGDNLATINTNTANIPAKGQALAAASLPVVLTAIQQTALTPPAAITGFTLEAGHIATIDTSTAASKTDLDTIVTNTNKIPASPAQEGGNLATIQTNTANIPAKGQATMANSTPVAIASNQSAVPVSGTVTANVGTTNGIALDTSVNGVIVAQGSSTSGEKGPLVQGAVTTAAPSYTTAQTSPISLTTAGAMRVDASATTQPVSGTFWQGTQPVSGTVTANAGTNLNTSSLALDTSVNGVIVAQGSTTSGEKGALVQGAVTTSAPSYTTAQTSPISLTTAGAVRTDASATTQPVSASSLPLPSGASTAAKQPALGTAGSASTDVLSVQGIASMTALKVDGSAVTQPVSGTFWQATQPVSGTVTANAGTGTMNVAQQASGSASATLQSAQTGNANGTSLTVLGLASAVFTVTTSTFTGTVNFEGTEDNSNWSPLLVLAAGGTTTSTTTTAAGQYTASCAGLQSVRARTSGVSAGNVTVTGHAVPVSYANISSGSGGSGGTSSSFGSAFPGTGTALGASDGTNMQGLLVESSSNKNLRVALYNGGTEASVTGSNALKVDGSAVTQPVSGTFWQATQPVSGTVTANAGTGTMNVAQQASGSVSGTLQSAATSTGVGTALTVLGMASAVFTISGTFTGLSITWQGTEDNSNWSSLVATQLGTNTISTTASALGDYEVSCAGLQQVRANVTAIASNNVTVTAHAVPVTFSTRVMNANQAGTWNINNVSGTVALPTGASTSAKQPALGTAGSASSDVLSVQGIASMTALKVDGSAVTQPVSGTITANAGTNLNTSSLALDTSVNGVIVSQGSTTSGEKGPLVQGAVTTAAPSYTTAQTSPISLTTAGAVRVDGSAVTQPVSGTFWQGTQPVSGTVSVNAIPAGSNVIGSTTIQATSGTALQADQSNSELKVSNYGKNSAAGDTAIAVNSAGDVKVAGDFVEQASLSAGSLNADLVASTDVSAYKWLSLHINANAYSGTLTFQASNDNSSWVNVLMYRIDTAASTNAASNTSLTSTIFAGSVQFRYFRTRMTSYTSGTAQGTLELYTSPPAFPLVTMAAVESGTWTVQPGNTANSTAWLTQPVAGTTGGSTASHTMSAASTNATSLKGSAGMLYGLCISNANAAARYFKLYNKASAPTVGTDTPVLTLQIPANGTAIRAYPVGLVLGTGIAWAATTGIADSDTGAVGSNDLSVDIDYK